MLTVTESLCYTAVALLDAAAAAADAGSQLLYSSVHLLIYHQPVGLPVESESLATSRPILTDVTGNGR